MTGHGGKLVSAHCLFLKICSVVDPDPHHFGNLDPHTDEIKICIRNRINLQMTSQNV
jgi:hypothetical protein